MTLVVEISRAAGHEEIREVAARVGVGQQSQHHTLEILWRV